MQASSASRSADRHLHTPLLIVGGGTGGVAAALAAARDGQACVVTEPTAWVGGQLTSQAVPPDENQWIEGDAGFASATASYLDFRRRVRRLTKDRYYLTAEAEADPRLNPGRGWVSHLCCEPALAHEVLRGLLQPHLDAGLVTLLLHHEPVSAETTDRRVGSVTLRDLRDGSRLTVTADHVIDATECGDLLPLTGTAYAVGAEHRDVHGELHGRTDRDNFPDPALDHDPTDQQAISWCFALEHHPGEDHTIPKPAGYERWAAYRPDLDDPWPGPLFSWTVCGEHNRPRFLPMIPWPDEPPAGEGELWRYRRIVDRSLHRDTPQHPAPPDVSLVNWVQMDYFRRPTLDVSPSQQRAAFDEARQQSLCFLYWLQTAAPRHAAPSQAVSSVDPSEIQTADATTGDSAADGPRRGYPGLKLHGRALGTQDGFAMAPYIREARRLVARTIVTEAHVGTQQRREAGVDAVAHPHFAGIPAHRFPDSVGIGHYRLDLHPTAAGRNSIYVDAAPFQIPLGSLIPVETENLLAGGKNLGVTHITNGCYRLHPVEWNIGEAAGALAAWCLRHETTPAQVHTDRDGELSRFQDHLRQRGVTLEWPFG